MSKHFIKMLQWWVGSKMQQVAKNAISATNNCLELGGSLLGPLGPPRIPPRLKRTVYRKKTIF